MVYAAGRPWKTSRNGKRSLSGVLPPPRVVLSFRRPIRRARAGGRGIHAVHGSWRSDAVVAARGETPLHSTGAASPAALRRRSHRWPICSLLTPCQPGTPPVSVRRGFRHGLAGVARSPRKDGLPAMRGSSFLACSGAAPCRRAGQGTPARRATCRLDFRQASPGCASARAAPHRRAAYRLDCRHAPRRAGCRGDRLRQAAETAGARARNVHQQTAATIPYSTGSTQAGRIQPAPARCGVQTT